MGRRRGLGSKQDVPSPAHLPLLRHGMGRQRQLTRLRALQADFVGIEEQRLQSSPMALWELEWTQ